MSSLKDLFRGPPQWTLGVAESVSSGRVQTRATAHTGSSEFFLGGITAYTLEGKVKHLGVNRREAEACNCVSALIAEQMARGACRLFGSDVGVATTGWAEPSPADGVEEPFAWWALVHLRGSTDLHVETGRVDAPHATRVDAQALIADTLVNRLIRYLQNARSSS